MAPCLGHEVRCRWIRNMFTDVHITNQWSNISCEIEPVTTYRLWACLVPCGIVRLRADADLALRLEKVSGSVTPASLAWILGSYMVGLRE